MRWQAAAQVQLFSPRGSRLPGHLVVNVLVGSRRTFLLYRDRTTEIILTTIGSDEGSKQAIGLGEARIREAKIEV